MLESEPAVRSPRSGNTHGKAERRLGLQAERGACVVLPGHRVTASPRTQYSSALPFPQAKVMTDSGSSFHAQTARPSA